MKLFAVADHKIESLAKTMEWFQSHYPNSKCLFASNGQQLLELLQKEKELPDIVFMDMNMPVMDGCGACFYLKLFYPSIKVIGFSRFADYEMIRQAFISGVDGFIWKSEVAMVLQEAIAKVTEGAYYIDTRFSTKIDGELFKRIVCHKEKFWERALSKLDIVDEDQIGNTSITKRERQLLVLATSTMSYKEIAQLMNISLKAVENLAQRLFKKLGVNNIKDLILFSLKHGYSVQASFMFLEEGNWLEE